VTIAHLVLTLDHGGLEHLVLQMAEQLQRRGLRALIVVLTDGTLVAEARRRQIETFVLEKRDGFEPQLIVRLARLFRAERVDLVHTHNFAPLIYGTLAARLTGLPTVNTRHGRAALSTHRLIWSLTHRVVAVSEDARRQLVRHNQVREDRLSVIVNGIDLSRFSGRHRADGLRAALGIAPGVPLIGTVGRLAAEKDQRTLLTAFARLREAGSPAHLAVAGGGPLGHELAALARSLAIESSVHFLGPRSDVPAILSALDVFVLPSLMEGISLTLIEAMASGLPVVTTRVGGNPEVVVDGDTGLLVPVGDAEALASAMGALLGAPEEARAMGERGRRRAEAVFNGERMIDAYEEIYATIASVPVRRRAS